MIEFNHSYEVGITMKAMRLILVMTTVLVFVGCASTSKPVRKLTKPVDQTAAELVKIRELKSGGETRAVVSPADQKQLKITF